MFLHGCPIGGLLRRATEWFPLAETNHDARQWADGGTRPTNSLMWLSMRTVADRLFLQVLLEVHAAKNVRSLRFRDGNC